MKNDDQPTTREEFIKTLSDSELNLYIQVCELGVQLNQVADHAKNDCRRIDLLAELVKRYGARIDVLEQGARLGGSE